MSSNFSPLGYVRALDLFFGEGRGRGHGHGHGRGGAGLNRDSFNNESPFSSNDGFSGGCRPSEEGDTGVVAVVQEGEFGGSAYGNVAAPFIEDPGQFPTLGGK